MWNLNSLAVKIFLLIFVCSSVRNTKGFRFSEPTIDGTRLATCTTKIKTLETEIDYLREKISVMEMDLQRSTSKQPPTSTLETTGQKARDCGEINHEMTSTKKRTIYPSGPDEPGVEVLCDHDTDGGRWTTIQRRSSGPKLDFYRGWDDYERGFGSLDRNFWIGLKTIHALTKNRDQELRIDMWDFRGLHAFAQYSNFSISDSTYSYQLSISGYSGTAGDGMTPDYDSWNLDGMPFSTKDRSNKHWSMRNCANVMRGGWWFQNCGFSNLNGPYYEAGERQKSGEYGILWNQWHNSDRSLRRVEMKVRSRETGEGNNIRSRWTPITQEAYLL